MKSVVMLFDARKGEFVKEEIYTLSPMKAMISAVMQYKGDFNTQNYPSKLDGIYKSNVIKDRLLYNLSDDFIMYSQKA
jgi:hypothetical protein